MDVSLNRRSLRARSSRYRKLFTGKKLFLWRTALAVLVVLSGLAWLDGFIAGVWLGGAAALLVAQFLIWNRLYLRELAPSENLNGEKIRLDQVAEADLLVALRSPQSPKQLFSSLRQSWQLNFVVNRLHLSAETIEQVLSDHPQDMEQVHTRAIEICRALGTDSLRAGAVVAALILQNEGSKQWLAQNKLQPEDVLKMSHWQIRTDTIMNKLQHKRSFGGVARDWAAGYTPLLNRFGRNLSTDVEHGVYQHLYLQTHSQVLDQALQFLSQPSNNTVALVGGTGSGKTSVVYALAERLLDPRNRTLQYHKVFSLNASLIVSEAKRKGNLEAILLHIIAEARKARNVILFFDDAHSFFNEEAGASDMTNVLLQVIRSSSVRMVFALRPSDWQYLASVASDVTASVQQLVLGDLDRDTVERVMQDQSLAIEAETQSIISYPAIREAYQLADRYVPDQAFPGKAITLLKNAAASAQGGWVVPETVQQIIESTLGVKVGSAAPEETDVLLNLEQHLHQHMINQDFAVGVVADALRRARAGVRSTNRPVGSFLFLGPTGVGKTELCKALARVYFNGADKIVRVDMSEYSHGDSSQRLLGSSANPGSFLSAVRQSPFSVVLLDEIEKASAEVLNLLLQLLDEGQLTDSDGRQVSFRDTIVIATSNAGADLIRSNIEQGHNLEEFSASFVDQLIDSKQFKPELINRFDEVVLFRPLNKDELRQVVQLLLGEVNQNLVGQQISINLTEAAIETIVEQGYDPRLGARPMRRMMQRTVENIVAKRMLAGELNPGDQAVLDAADVTLE